MTPEGKVKTQVKRILERHAVYWTMPATGGYGSSGTPDFLVCTRGHFLAIECKAGDNKPTALQLRAHAAIEAAYGSVLVLNEDNLSTLEFFLKGSEKPND